MSKVVNVVVGAVAGFFTGGLVGAVVGAVGAFAASEAQERREKAANRAVAEQRKASAVNRAQQTIERQRQIRQSIAEARVQRAIIASRGFDGGPAGAGQSITGDTASAIGAARTQQGAAFGISQAQDRASQFGVEARSSNRFDTIAGIANVFSSFATANQQGKFEGLFGDS